MIALAWWLLIAPTAAPTPPPTPPPPPPRPAVLIATPRGDTSVPLPIALGSRYRWDAAAARFEELRAAGAAAPAANPLTGLRLHHGVLIDPGHGGADPGNPGRYFPGLLTEKDVTLAIARLLRAELLRRG